ncbi:hypothetical protein CYMTET_28568 [Cymbomonas tetramitiformis]|uniref:Uncharacterized protein n=1 Tax=Cymbomonas tetramitiformis TaxID=36881 RepID=A0AAE0FMP7_9CHLO|nr:hypothetical protein CYMTET_28568 [Cymbomonas tetramitiformis]
MVESAQTVALRWGSEGRARQLPVALGAFVDSPLLWRARLLEMCNHLAAGRAPEEAREWLAGAQLVALLKDDLGVNVRPIVSGRFAGSSWQKSFASSTKCF